MAEKRRWKFGEVRPEDGFVFKGYDKKKLKDGTIVERMQFMRPEVFARYVARQRERAVAAYHRDVETSRKRQRDWLKKNSDKMKRWREEYYAADPEKWKQAYKNWREVNREKLREQSKLRYHKDPVKRRLSTKNWREKNLPKVKDQWRNWYEANGEQRKAKVKEWRSATKSERAAYARSKRQTDPAYRLADNLRRRINRLLKGRAKPMSSIKLLGCSTDFLRAHIERQFTGEMSWHAAKSFHIDHIVPLGAFDLASKEELVVACNWQNLRPVTPEANLRKGGKLTKNELALLQKIGGAALKARIVERVRTRAGKVRLL